MSRLTTVPFSGFYDSWHNEALDNALNSMVSDETGCHPYESIRERMFDLIPWGDVHAAYARKFCAAFAEEYGIDLKFESMSSPKYYNYETDRIFAYISDEEARRLFDAVDRDALQALIRSRFTSGSGFISHYSNDLEDWGDVDMWDHNQLGTLVEAYAVQELGRDDEPLDLPILQGMFSPYEVLSYALPSNQEINRLFTLVEYLNRRSQRNQGGNR